MESMPASPHQVLVPAPRSKASEEAAATRPIEAEAADLRLTTLAALILVCPAASGPDLQDCTRDNARVVMRVPEEFVMPIACLMHAQAYLAETSVGRELDADERVRVVCIRSQTLSASLRR